MDRLRATIRLAPPAERVESLQDRIETRRDDIEQMREWLRARDKLDDSIQAARRTPTPSGGRQRSRNSTELVIAARLMGRDVPYLRPTRYGTARTESRNSRQRRTGGRNPADRVTPRGVRDTSTKQSRARRNRTAFVKRSNRSSRTPVTISPHRVSRRRRLTGELPISNPKSSATNNRDRKQQRESVTNGRDHR